MTTAHYRSSPRYWTGLIGHFSISPLTSGPTFISSAPLTGIVLSLISLSGLENADIGFNSLSWPPDEYISSNIDAVNIAKLKSDDQPEKLWDPDCKGFWPD